MTPERPRGSELTQLVADHVLGHVYLHMFTTVVHHEGYVHEFWNDRASTCPGLDRLDTSRFTLLLNFEKQLWIDVRAFLATSAHEFSFNSLQ